MSNRALHGIGDWALLCDSDDDMDNQATTPLSFGSDMHESGRCKPCTHFHRPEGCAHGDTCRFCHSCPPGEKQRRKRDRRREVGQRNAKIYATARNETPSIVPADTCSTHQSVADPLHTASPAALGLEDNSEAGYGIGTMDFVVCTFVPVAICGWSDVINPHNERDDQATTTVSFGSDMHASGQCKPCTHFHRPEGCAHGDTCRFCHCCPPGEKQRRKCDRRRAVGQHQNKKSMNVRNETPSTELVDIRYSNPSRANPIESASSASLGPDGRLELGHDIGTMNFVVKNTSVDVEDPSACKTIRRIIRSNTLPKEWKSPVCFNHVPSSNASTECSPRSLFSSATEKEFNVILVA